MKSLPTSYTAARKWGIILLLALASLGAALLSMSFGSTQVPFSEILTALMGGETQAYEYRGLCPPPRTLAALLCGSALAVGGVIIQGVLGNPLAGPNIIGVNAGAPGGSPLRRPDSDLYDGGPGGSFPGGAGGVYAGVHPGPEDRGQPHHPGAGRGGHEQHALRRHRRGLHPVPGGRPGGRQLYGGPAVWGDSGRPEGAGPCPSWGGAGAFAMSYELDLLTLGDEVAQSLGLSARAARNLLLTLAAVLCGAAVSFAGLVGFVGLLVPHAARFLVGGEHKYLLAASLFLGAALVTVCDLAARVLFVPFELPVGILLSLMGGPFFLWLLFRQRGGRRT